MPITTKKTKKRDLIKKDDVDVKFSEPAEAPSFSGWIELPNGQAPQLFHLVTGAEIVVVDISDEPGEDECEVRWVSNGKTRILFSGTSKASQGSYGEYKEKLV